MATCKECLSEKVCRYNDGHNLYCKEGYVCPHFISKYHFEISKCEEKRLRKLCDERLQEIHKLNQVINNINYMIHPIIESEVKL
jgi:hypothetical protein